MSLQIIIKTWIDIQNFIKNFVFYNIDILAFDFGA